MEDGLRRRYKKELEKERECKEREGWGVGKGRGGESRHGNVERWWVFQPVLGCSVVERHNSPCPEGNHSLF